MTRLFAAASASVLALALAACGEAGAPGEPGAQGSDALTGADTGDAQAGGGLAVTQGWVRNPIAGRDVTAGFFTVEGGGEAGRLTGVESAEAERIELHTMTMEGDVMRMRQVEAMDVPADGALNLSSGGDHLMIFGVSADAAADGVLDVVLQFEGGRSVEAQLPFADTAPAVSPASDMPGMQEG
ncbi:MAG: copper chaperone PCu(A)C [Oceanicaulis sp.]